MKFEVVSLVILNIILWYTLFRNYVDSAIMLIRKPTEYYVTCLGLFLTMSIGYPQSLYYYIGSGFILFTTLSFIAVRIRNQNKVAELLKKYEDIVQDSLNKIKQEEKNLTNKDHE